MPEGQRKITKDIRNIAIAVGVAILIGLIFVVGHKSTPVPPATTAPSSFGALLWSLACLVSGGFIGFLFGIPKVLQSNTTAVATTPGGTPPTSTAQNPNNHRPNTNLDEISDWLTKIIVGLGLINLQKIPDALNRAAQFVASIGSNDQSFAGALIVYFTVLGLLGTYLITRIYLAKVIATTDVSLGITDEEKHRILSSDLSNPVRPQLPSDTQLVATKILDVTLSDLSSLTDIIAWSKAQFNSKNFVAAVEGYRRAVELAPTDAQLRCEFTNALYYLWKSEADDTKKLKLRAEAKNQLMEAYRLVQGPTDPLTKMKVYRAITFHYLYDPPPDGFTTTIKYGTEYINAPDPQKISSGGLLVNLASAHGQQFRWLQKQAEQDVAVLCEARNGALMAAAAALKIDNNNIWLNRLRQLLQHDAQKDPLDNDLEVFESDNKFRALLALPAVADDKDTGKNCPDPQI